MDQLHLLWEYQKADVEVDKMEASIKRSPVRQKLVKYRDYYAEQQNTMKRIENEVSAMQDRLEALKDAIKMTDDQIFILEFQIPSLKHYVIICLANTELIINIILLLQMKEIVLH